MAAKHDESKGRPIPQVETGTGKHRTESDSGSLPSGAKLSGAEQIATPDESGEQRDGLAGPWS